MVLDDRRGPAQGAADLADLEARNHGDATDAGRAEGVELVLDEGSSVDLRQALRAAPQSQPTPAAGREYQRFHLPIASPVRLGRQVRFYPAGNNLVTTVLRCGGDHSVGVRKQGSRPRWRRPPDGAILH